MLFFSLSEGLTVFVLFFELVHCRREEECPMRKFCRAVVRDDCCSTVQEHPCPLCYNDQKEVCFDRSNSSLSEYGGDDPKGNRYLVCLGRNATPPKTASPSERFRPEEKDITWEGNLNTTFPIGESALEQKDDRSCSKTCHPFDKVIREALRGKYTTHAVIHGDDCTGGERRPPSSGDPLTFAEHSTLGYRSIRARRLKLLQRPNVPRPTRHGSLAHRLSQGEARLGDRRK